MLFSLVLQVAFAGDAAETTLAEATLHLDAGPQGSSVHTLPNGLVVVLQEDHRTDTVALAIRYAVGSHDEKYGERGCAHLFEHLMFEGSAHVGPNKFDEWLTGAGGENNAFTSDDETTYHMTFPSGAADLGLFLESDRAGWLLDGVTQENLDNQRSVVLQERAEGYEAPNGRDWDALQTLAFPEGNPYHVPVIGTVAQVQGFQVPAVKGFFQAHYRPRNATLVIVGNFNTDEMLAKVTTWFGEVPDPGPAVERPAVQPLAPFSADGYLEDDVQQRTLYLSWPTVPLNDPDEPALDLLSYVLSDGRGTRLDDALYYDKEITTDDGTYSGEMDTAGTFIVYATAQKLSLAKLDAKITTVLDEVVTTPPTAAELDRAKREIKAGWLGGIETLEDRALWVADCQYYHGRPDCLADQWKRYEAVTTDDLVRVAQKYLVPERRVTLSVVPKGDGGQLVGAVPVELP